MSSLVGTCSPTRLCLLIQYYCWGRRGSSNAIAHCLENQFTYYDLFDETQARWVEARAKAVLETVGNNPPLPLKFKTKRRPKAVRHTKTKQGQWR